MSRDEPECTIRPGVSRCLLGEKVRYDGGHKLDLFLATLNLHGFVFKKNSPSSGLFRVRVYDQHGVPARVGTGIFPREVMKRFPLLPLEEEGRLHNMQLRENFVERVFVYCRWTRLLDENPTGHHPARSGRSSITRTMLPILERRPMFCQAPISIPGASRFRVVATLHLRCFS